MRHFSTISLPIHFPFPWKNRIDKIMLKIIYHPIFSPKPPNFRFSPKKLFTIIYGSGYVTTATILFCGNIYNGFKMSNEQSYIRMLDGFSYGAIKAFFYSFMSWGFPFYVKMRHNDRYNNITKKNGLKIFKTHYNMHLIPNSLKIVESDDNRLINFFIRKGIIIR
jgi:hypothetical protein